MKLNSESIGKIGELHVETMTHRSGHAWRDQSEKSPHIDGIIEVKESGKFSGKFILVQVKSGKSYLSGFKNKTFSIKIDPTTAQYLLGVPFPSLFVWYDDNRGRAFWSEVTERNLSPKRSRIRIPKRQSLGEHSYRDMIDVTRRWWGIEDNLPRLDLRIEPRVRVRDIKLSARQFYDEWRKEDFYSAAFGYVNITLKGWRHLTMASRPQEQIVRRLSLLGSAKQILENVPIFHLCRRINDKGISYYMQTAMIREKHRANAVVSVIVEVPDLGTPTFYSVFEHRSRALGGEPVPRGLLGATAR